MDSVSCDLFLFTHDFSGAVSPGGIQKILAYL